MSRLRLENPFVFGEIIDQRRFVDREMELDRLVRDVADGQKVFLLSPRRFGKSSLVSMAFLKLQKQYVRTVNLSVSSYSSYGQFLEKFAEKVLRAAGPWDRVKDWVTRFLRRAHPEANANLTTGEISISLGREANADPSPLAPDVFALPGELTRNGGFRMAICLDEFQQIQNFDSGTVEGALRNEVQKQRQVGYVFSGSQPTLMDQMLSPKRPFHKTGPRMFLDKIPAAAWQRYITEQFRARGRALSDTALARLFAAADLIPYDVQRLAHELWDYAELQERSSLGTADVDAVIHRVIGSQAPYYERLWQQLSGRQRTLLLALATRGPDELLSQAVRMRFEMGPASSVQKAIQSLMARDVIDRYQGRYFFLDPLQKLWLQRQSA
jgi:hypothetical protein